MYPRLVVGANTPARIVIESRDINEFGEKSVIVDGTFKVNYQSNANVNISTQKQTPQVTGSLFVDGDIAPTSPIINGGYVVVFGVKHDIAKGTKARNLDGSVNYTRLDVI